MNTEQMISIDFCRNITPIILKEFLYNSASGQEFEVTEAGLKNISSGQNNDHLFVISFSNRPNTGKQPVADDVIVDAYYESEWNEVAADYLDWALDDASPISKWKPNHEAMLAKSKEQGANTMNEQEHKAKSHEVALMTNALDDNPDEQVIEPWVGDQLDDLINPVSEGCQAGEPLKPEDFGATPDKPVFTQEAHKAGKLPPILSKCEFNYQEDSRWPTGVVVAYYGNGVVIVDDHDVPFVKYQHELRPIDNRTDEQRAVDDLIEIMQSNEHTYPEIIGLIKDGKIHGVKWIIE